MAKFLKFSNSDGKEWVMPTKNMRTALSLYQPSGLKGRLLCRFLPCLYWSYIVRKVLNIKEVEMPLGEEMVSTIKRVLEIDDFEFSIFEGTPSVHQKRVIQVFQGSKILAYCKVSNKSEVIEMIHKEKEVLDYFNSKGFSNVPMCYHCAKVDNVEGEVLFIGSTVKSKHFKAVHKWSDRHWELLIEMCERTKAKMMFEDTDMGNSLVELESYLDALDPKDAYIIRHNIELLSFYYGGQEVEFSMYHGDFVPWNMFLEKGELFVFDFEYSGFSYPPYLDWFHFFTQTSRYEKHLSVEKIYEKFLLKELEIESYCLDARICYKAYLLDLISRCFKRNHGEIDNNFEKFIHFSIEMLVRL